MNQIRSNFQKILFENRLGLECLTQLYHGSKFYWWRKPEYLEKTTNLSQVNDNLFENIFCCDKIKYVGQVQLPM